MERNENVQMIILFLYLSLVLYRDAQCAHTHTHPNRGGNYRLCHISCKALWSGTLAEEQSAAGHVWNPALIAWRDESRGLWLRLQSAVLPVRPLRVRVDGYTKHFWSTGQLSPRHLESNVQQDIQSVNYVSQMGQGTKVSVTSVIGH